MTNQDFLTIKEAAAQYNRSEQTIRRLVKHHIDTDYVRSKDSPKGMSYQVDKALLQKEYGFLSVGVQLSSIADDSLRLENKQLKEDISERNQLIQQLQNRLFEQGDMINALANQLTSQQTNQKMIVIEELLLHQNDQLRELQKRLPSFKNGEPVMKRRSLWHLLFKR